MRPRCDRGCLSMADYVVLLKDDPGRRRYLCAECAADAMTRRFTISVVDGLAVWGSA